jgi:hypothetical protein
MSLLIAPWLADFAPAGRLVALDLSVFRKQPMAWRKAARGFQRLLAFAP